MDKLKNNIGIVMLILGLVGSTGSMYSKFAKMELTIENLSTATAPDTSGIKDNEKEIAILQKEIKLLNLTIAEIKEQSKNPLQ
tara:strand:+ start:1126 stop:1374 length:249 start_codon:yes stop_codon:yes gene_type:complete